MQITENNKERKKEKYKWIERHRGGRMNDSKVEIK
jgi:hypothetical protein